MSSKPRPFNPSKIFSCKTFSQNGAPTALFTSIWLSRSQLKPWWQQTLASVAIGWLVGWVIELDIISPENWIPQHFAFEMIHFWQERQWTWSIGI